jgi:ATP-binding cassette subfamily B multidrug efflux pump
LFERWIDAFSLEGRRHNIPEDGFRFIAHFALQDKLPILAMLVFSGATSLIEVIILGEIGRLIDLLPSVPKEEVFSANWQWFSTLIVLIVICSTLSLSAMTLVELQTLTPSYFNKVRWQSHKQVQRQSLSFFQSDFAGRIASKVMMSGSAVGDLTLNLMQNIWLFVIYIAATLWVSSTLDVRVSIIYVVWLASFLAIVFYYVPISTERAHKMAESSSVLSGRVVDCYSNAHIVKLFSDADREDKFIQIAISNYIESVRSFTRSLTVMRILLGSSNGILVGSIVVYSVILWQSNDFSIGSVALATSLAIRLTSLSARVLAQFTALFRNFGIIQNSAKMIGKPNHTQNCTNAESLNVTRGEISFRDVHFRYGEGLAPALKGVSFTVRPGEKVGIVGPSGAGKTTLINTLLRFYDIDEGTIEIDGQAVAQVSQESLRRNIGVVSQDTALFHRSILENIAYGRQDASRAEIELAARKAEAHEFISELRDQNGRVGYDVHVGERGVRLSGGQRQRVAIARVILKNAPILILDEATSALDSNTELSIQLQLRDLMGGKTVIAIAHRLSTIAAMDRLVVIDDGRLVEEGKHADLLKRNGLYARLWECQSGDFIGDWDKPGGRASQL